MSRRVRVIRYTDADARREGYVDAAEAKHDAEVNYWGEGNDEFGNPFRYEFEEN